MQYVFHSKIILSQKHEHLIPFDATSFKDVLACLCDCTFKCEPGVSVLQYEVLLINIS